jgi:hypothetical protein
VFARVAAPRAGKAKVGRTGFALELEDRPAPSHGATSPHGVVGRSWARAWIDHMITSQATPAEISRVAMNHGLVSPYTAMVAVGEDIVERGGTRLSVAVPVAVPRGMRWQARYRDHDRDDGVDARPDDGTSRDGKLATSGKDGSPPAGVSPPVTPTRGPDSGPTRDVDAPIDASGGRGGGGDDDVVDGKHTIDVDRSGGADEATRADDDAAAAAATSTSTGAVAIAEAAPQRGGLVLGGRVAGGVAIAADTRRGMGAVGARLALALERKVALGVDLSFWVIGTDPDYAFRTLATATVLGLAGGWIDLSVGAGLHLGDDAGFGYSAGLRLGRGWIGPTVRWDGALLRGADDEYHSTGAVGVGVEADF